MNAYVSYNPLNILFQKRNNYLFSRKTLSGNLNLSQTSFGHISINSSKILMVLMAMESS